MIPATRNAAREPIRRTIAFIEILSLYVQVETDLALRARR
jgi:hypothetical protein